MSKMAKKKRRIPKAYLYIDKDFGTRSIQHPRTGKMMGRKRVRGKGDSTAVLRVKKGEHIGEIWGRTPPVRVRGSKKARGHLRRNL